MRKITILLLIIPIALAQITGYVNDYADIIPDQQEQELGQICGQLQQSGTAEYAIVTVNSLEGEDIEGYALKLAEGVLGDKQKNNGLLLLVALDDRKYRFEVGRGLEPELPDIIMGRIGREYIVDNFRAGEYGKGILEASKAVQATLTNETGSEYYIPEQNPRTMIIPIAIFLSIFTFIIVMIILSAAKKGKRSDDDYFLAALFAGSMMRGGGFSGGGFGGGFGGGSFGGGGASGGW